MRAHQLDADGVIINTIVVDSLDVFPDLVDALIGGVIGDRVIDGAVIPAAPPAGPSFEMLEKVYLDSVRALREKALGRLNGYGAALLLSEPPAYADEKALCSTIIKGLLDITTTDAVKAAIATEDFEALQMAVKTEYARLVGMASENMVKAFRQVDL